MKKLFIFIVILFAFHNVQANNIQVSNGTLTGQDTAQGYWLVQFDLSWENSWRTDNLIPNDGNNVGNWDAAWVFVKYRVGNGEWQHAKLHNSGHSVGTGTPANLDIGVPNERLAFHISDNPGVGAFIYRSQNGSGTFSTIGNQLRWNYGVDDVPHNAVLEIRIFAIEMVYVAPGAFWVGSGGTETGHFRAGGGSGPFLVTDTWNGCIANTSGCLWGASNSGSSTIGETGSLNEHYPTGVNGFYSMKFEISQQQYVDFLNVLTPSQASTRRMSGGNRNGITVSGGVHTTSNPYVANNFMSWQDGAAYLDWAGLRPMTELEYEKAARGPAIPVANEYAWGSLSITRTMRLDNLGQANEDPIGETIFFGSFVSNLDPNEEQADESPNFIIPPMYIRANANFENSTNINVNGPVRVGSYAFGTITRERSGAGYWGIMELSGNLYERPVTVNNPGRNFSGLHGNGMLTSAGYGAVEDWPGGGASGITDAIGSGLRGGSWNTNVSALQVSNRNLASHSEAFRDLDFGFRGVRSLPVAVGE